jgi:hypothetical protein
MFEVSSQSIFSISAQSRRDFFFPIAESFLLIAEFKYSDKFRTTV